MGFTIKNKIKIPKVDFLGSPSASCVGVPSPRSPGTAGLVFAAGTPLPTSPSATAVFGCFYPLDFV